MKQFHSRNQGLLLTIAVLIFLLPTPSIQAKDPDLHNNNNHGFLRSFSETTHPTCDETCNGQNCWRNKCSGCEFYCGGVCTFTEKNSCQVWCKEDDCHKKFCSDCLFCSNTKSTCPLVTFEDATSTIFPTNDKYWYQWKHSGMPYYHEGAPLFVDINDDGMLDYFNSMHGHKPDVNGYDRMELGVSVPPSFNMDGIESESLPNSDFQRLRHVSERIIIEEAFDDPIIRTMDPHGQNIADLDGDGILDLLISSGGNQGQAKGGGRRLGEEHENVNIMTLSRDNFLLWGEEGIDPLTNETITSFRGGRSAAVAAGVHMRYGRGRVNYILDVNGDGLLDIFCLHDRRVSNELAPGVLLINQGNRTWREDRSMMEYTRSMMVTDADGDGYAQEILLNRGFCYPDRDGPEQDPNYPWLGEYPSEIKSFCSTRPVGSTAVYKFNHTSNAMEEISPKYQNISPDKFKQPACCPNGSNSGMNDCHAKSMVSADFDGDLKADHVVLFDSKMMIYYSMDRSEGTLPIGHENAGADIRFPSYCKVAQSVRVIDLDNDGVEELVVMCKNPGTFLVYSKGATKGSWSLNNECNDNGSLGALNDISNVRLMSTFLDEKLCNENGTQHEWNELEKICDNYAKVGKPPSSFAAGLCLTDLDNDGFVDAVVSYNFGYLRFFKNRPSSKSLSNRFIAFKLKGDGMKVNQYGIGATVILESDDGSSGGQGGGTVEQFREMSSYQHTSDKYGCKEDRIIFGLGEDLEPRRVTVRWPNGEGQSWDIAEDLAWSYSPRLDPIELAMPDAPSAAPSLPPTLLPSLTPSVYPSTSPSVEPSENPSASPSEPVPSTAPSSIPSSLPSDSPEPSVYPSYAPSNDPSFVPSFIPSVRPSSEPSESHVPSILPTISPSYSPEPSVYPSYIPSNHPSFVPSFIPSVHPSSDPSESHFPSVLPTTSPSTIPSLFPSIMPSAFPSNKPSSSPTLKPTFSPSLYPSISLSPTDLPSKKSSTLPSSSPSLLPSTHSSIHPSVKPIFSSMPSRIPRDAIGGSTGSLGEGDSVSSSLPNHVPINALFYFFSMGILMQFFL